jgi:hypothetical protein
MTCMDVLGYGGGRQTVAMCVLVARGVLPRPDRIVIADTGREAGTTWDYLAAHVQPLMAGIGLAVEIAPHALSTVDLYGKNGDLLIPAYTATGKLPTFCSNEWKQRVSQRYLRETGVGADVTVTTWIGFALDEKERIKGYGEGKWRRSYPLCDLMLSKHDCETIIAGAGLPLPHKSACFFCPHRSNEEWRDIRDGNPEEWAAAIAIDERVRAADDRGALYLHASRVPLREADIEAPDRRERGRQCALGTCYV